MARTALTRVRSREFFQTSWFASADCKAYYRFISSGMTTDSKGSNTLTAISVPITGTGVFGDGIVLAGDDAYSITDAEVLKPTGAFTVGAWIKTTGTTQFIFQSFSANTALAGFRFWVNASGLIRLDTGKNTGTTPAVDYNAVAGTTTVNDGNWHFVVAIWDGSNILLYRDGVLNNTPVAWAYAPAYAATNYVRIGCGNNTGTNLYFTTGSIDDVFLLNGTALTAAQVKALYEGTGITRTTPTYPRNSVGGLYIKGAKSIEASTGDTARTTSGWIEDEKYAWYFIASVAALSGEFDTAVTRTGAKTLKISTTNTSGAGSAITGYNAAPPATASIETLKKYATPCKPSTSYTFNCYAKTDNVATNSVYATVLYFTSGGVRAGTNTQKLSGTNDWTLLTATFTTGADDRWMTFYCYNVVAGNVSDAWFDVNSLTLVENGVSRNAVA